ncbi:MAG: M48 family metallopeptidase [Alphaproteobacteria bacterium]|nr:M48 family metallopeptidase [Alphaproteobacteria bacterium]
MELAGRTVKLRVRKSARAKRVALHVDAASEGVELVLPHRVALATGLEFLREKRGWVEQRLALLPERIRFDDGAEVPILGVPHRIRHRGERAGGRPTVEIAAGEIRVFGPAAHIARRVRDHLMVLAREEIARRARRLAARIERRVARVSVRDPKSRWGSCASSGNLAFSWRLILAPETVLHYVVAHEVAHLIEMNHGVRFWRLVEQLAPGAARQRLWLKRNRARLFRYG